jgi:hypothetical protein
MISSHILHCIESDRAFGALARLRDGQYAVYRGGGNPGHLSYLSHELMSLLEYLLPYLIYGDPIFTHQEACCGRGSTWEWFWFVFLVMNFTSMLLYYAYLYSLIGTAKPSWAEYFG